MGKIEGRKVQREPLREGECIGDGDPHIGDPHLGNNRTIDIFYHGMHDTLWVNLDNDLLDRDVEKPVGLDDLESFVHEGGGINGDFLTHLPVRMVQGFLHRHFVKF